MVKWNLIIIDWEFYHLKCRKKTTHLLLHFWYIALMQRLAQMNFRVPCRPSWFSMASLQWFPAKHIKNIFKLVIEKKAFPYWNLRARKVVEWDHWLMPQEYILWWVEMQQVQQASITRKFVPASLMPSQH